MSKPTDNEDFIDYVFSDRGVGEVFVSSIPGDPGNPAYGYPRHTLSADEEPGFNNFFCVSQLVPSSEGKVHRTPSSFGSLHVLVVDDVGTKLSKGRVEAILGRPSYIIESSPDNFQWGYKLDTPETDRARAEGLIRGLCDTFTPDVAGVNRLVRLPFGINGKPKYGTPSPKTTLRYFDPDRTVTSDDMMKALDASPLDVADFGDRPFPAADKDPVLKAMELQYHTIHYDQIKNPGIYPITCPWVSDHTDAIDNGSVYIAPTGFKCWHGHCQKKNFRDLREFLGLTSEEIDAVAIDAFVDAFGKDLPGEFQADEPEESLPVEDAVIEPANAANSEEEPDAFEEFSEIASKVKAWDASTFTEIMTSKKTIRWELVPKRDWLFQDLIQLCAPWFIAGKGGVGKSRLGLALCMSIASGKPFGSFIPDPAGHPTIFLTQEDDFIDRQHRFGTQFETWHERDPFSDDEYESLRKNLRVPTMTLGEQADEAMEAVVKSLADMSGAPRLILFDPLLSFWDDGERGEHGINTSRGALNTFRSLSRIASGGSVLWSAGMLHHLNKEGSSYGSVMLTNHSRACFDMRPETEGGGDDARKLARIELVKVNSSPKLGHEELYEFVGDHGSLWPTTLRFCGTHEEVLASLVIDGTIDSNMNTTAIVEACNGNLGFGADVPSRDRAIKAVLGEWSKNEGPDPMLGITRLSKGRTSRYQPTRREG